MALPSGAISMSQVNTFLSRSSTASLSFNDSQFRFIANQSSGSVSFSNLRGKQGGAGTCRLYMVSDGKGGSYYYGDRNEGRVTGQTDGYNLFVVYQDNTFGGGYLQSTSSSGFTNGVSNYRAQVGSGTVYSNWYTDAGSTGGTVLYQSSNFVNSGELNTWINWIAVRT